MVAYNFQKQFAPDVESGNKNQTIRKAGKRKPPKVGDQLQLYTGMRTKYCRLLRKVICASCSLIEIRPKNRNVLVGSPSGITIQWNRLTDGVIEKLALDDGFSSVDSFFQFFANQSDDGLFEGYLIEW